MLERIFFSVMAVAVLYFAPPCEAQSKLHRIGVITSGGGWYETIDGLRVGLRRLGLEERKHYVLVIRDIKNDIKAAEQAAMNLEQEKVDLIYTTQTSVTLPARRATAETPIVFCAGSDPVVLGLVDNFAKPGGRLTGVYYRDADLTAKRLEILKEMVPKLRRLLTFFDPGQPVASRSANFAQQTARPLGIEFIERHVASVDELQARMRSLRVGEADAFFEVSDPMVNSQEQLIIDTARVKRLPTMFVRPSSVNKGGLTSYGVSLHEVGRLSAKYVQRILAGTQPKDIPVEGVDKFELVINLKTAKQIGLTIPPNVLARADRVIK